MKSLLDIFVRLCQAILTILEEFVYESYYQKHMALIFISKFRHYVYLRLEAAHGDNFLLIKYRQFLTIYLRFKMIKFQNC